MGNAFRNIDIHPSDYHLLGFTWNGFYYYDKCLPMGASSSSQIFENVSCVLQLIMETKYQAAGMSHILDDFCLWVPQNQIKANKIWIISSLYALNEGFLSRMKKLFNLLLLSPYMVSR